MPWRHSSPSPIEEVLRENRPEPRPEFAAEFRERFDVGRKQRFRVPSLAPGRAFAVAALTLAAFVGATVAAGGPTQASKGLVGFVDVGNNTGKPDGGGNGDGDHHPGWPGNWEYTIPICHKKKNGNHYEWQLLSLSPHDAFVDLNSNHDDYIVTPWRPFPPH